jgi:RNA recognition motif-containing protein
MGAQTNRSRASLLSQLRLNFVLLPNCPRSAHNQTVTDRGNVVKNLFVGNLGSEVTHEELRRLFEAYGEVVQVHIIVDRDTGLPRGFAFVEMTNDVEAEKAIKGLNGSILGDRALGRELRSPQTRTPSSVGEREPQLHELRDPCGRMFPGISRSYTVFN